MGCTSSASNVPDVHTENTDEDKSKDISSESNNIKHLNEDDEDSNIDVLPTCDKFDENIQLASNNSSLDVKNQQVDNDDQPHGILKQDVRIPDTNVQETKEFENKFSTLKHVVDQVIINTLDDVQNVSTDVENKSICNENIEMEEGNENKIEETFKTQEKDDDCEQIQEEEEHIEESVSPSQSDCSRSTRWEALADIAAELPASLAIDPLTGQIYSLSK